MVTPVPRPNGVPRSPMVMTATSATCSIVLARIGRSPRTRCADS